MADVAIFDTVTGDLHIIYRDPEKDFAYIKANKPLLEGQSIADVSELQLGDITQLKTIELVRAHVLTLVAHA